MFILDTIVQRSAWATPSDPAFACTSSKLVLRQLRQPCSDTLYVDDTC